jgi:hypothetical protein
VCNEKYNYRINKIAGGCLLLLLLLIGGLFYKVRKFYNRTRVNPAPEEIFPTKRDTNFKQKKKRKNTKKTKTSGAK